MNKEEREEFAEQITSKIFKEIRIIAIVFALGSALVHWLER